MNYFLAATVSLGLCIGYAAHQFNEKAIKQMEYEKDAIRARAWNELPLKAILKQADPDLSTYFVKQNEQHHNIRDFQELKRQYFKLGDRDWKYTEMKHTLRRLRASPLFNTEYQAEFDAVLHMVINEESFVKCNTLIALFHRDQVFKQHVERAFPKCNQSGDHEIKLKEALTALEMKLIHCLD